MLAWSSGRSGAGSSRCVPANLPPPIRELSSEEDSEHDAHGALLAGAAARARRRHVIKNRRKSKIAFRAPRRQTSSTSLGDTSLLINIWNWNVLIDRNCHSRIENFSEKVTGPSYSRKQELSWDI
ncbi:unnamed protein product, partial [Brenthis ino]